MDGDFMKVPVYYVILKIDVVSIDTGCVIGKYTNSIYTCTYRNALSTQKKYKKRIGKRIDCYLGHPCVLNDVYIYADIGG